MLDNKEIYNYSFGLDNNFRFVIFKGANRYTYVAKVFYKNVVIQSFYTELDYNDLGKQFIIWCQNEALSFSGTATSFNIDPEKVKDIPESTSSSAK